MEAAYGHVEFPRISLMNFPFLILFSRVIYYMINNEISTDG